MLISEPKAYVKHRFYGTKVTKKPLSDIKKPLSDMIIVLSDTKSTLSDVFFKDSLILLCLC